MTDTEWKKTRSHIIRRDSYRCRVIGCTVKGVKNLTVHHIVPRDEGGGDHDANLITLCPKHHDQIEIAGIRIIPLIEAWDDELSPESRVVPRAILDSTSGYGPPDKTGTSTVHLCDETTIAVVLKLKKETGRPWVDLAKQLGYHASFSATLSAISRDIPGAISKDGEDELRKRINLTPIAPLTVKRSPVVGGPQQLHNKPRTPPVRKVQVVSEIEPDDDLDDCNLFWDYNNEWSEIPRGDTTVGVRVDDASKFDALAEMCGLTKTAMFGELIRFFSEAHKIGWTQEPPDEISKAIETIARTQNITIFEAFKIANTILERECERVERENHEAASGSQL